ncbi:MAG: exo-alpha-sialidase [Planctomycetes bacterium]|nr:exo-alpha-sialidase [Planctomycetota bacterium]
MKVIHAPATVLASGVLLLFSMSPETSLLGVEVRAIFKGPPTLFAGRFATGPEAHKAIVEGRQCDDAVVHVAGVIEAGLGIFSAGVLAADFPAPVVLKSRHLEGTLDYCRTVGLSSRNSDIIITSTKLKSQSKVQILSTRRSEGAVNWSELERIAELEAPEGQLSPRLVQTGKGELLVVVQARDEERSKLGKLECLRSVDQGKTWVIQPPIDGISSLDICTRCQAELRSNGSDLVGLLFCVKSASHDNLRLAVSFDGGRTFGSPANVPWSLGAAKRIPGRIGDFSFQDDYMSSPQSDRWPHYALETDHGLVVYRRGGIKVGVGPDARLEYPSRVLQLGGVSHARTLSLDGLNVIFHIANSGAVRLSAYAGDADLMSASFELKPERSRFIGVDAVQIGYVGAGVLGIEESDAGYSASFVSIASLPKQTWRPHGEK